MILKIKLEVWKDMSELAKNIFWYNQHVRIYVYETRMGKDYRPVETGRFIGD